jgi:hypothetical protein
VETTFKVSITHRFAHSILLHAFHLVSKSGIWLKSSSFRGWPSRAQKRPLLWAVC